MRDEFPTAIYLKPIPVSKLGQYSDMPVESLVPFLADKSLDSLRSYLPSTIAKDARKSFEPQRTPAQRMNRILKNQG